MSNRVYERDLLRYEQGVLDVLVEEGRARFEPQVGYVVKNYDGTTTVVRFAQIMADAEVQDQIDQAELERQQRIIEDVDMEDMSEFVDRLKAEREDKYLGRVAQDEIDARFADMMAPSMDGPQPPQELDDDAVLDLFLKGRKS